MQTQVVKSNISVAQSHDRITQVLVVCGAVAGPLFTLAWLIEGATRAGYNPLRHPISSLSLGALGWTQMLNFYVTGLLTVAFAFGLWRALKPLGGSFWGPLLIGAMGLGLLGAGMFATDPISGYPPGTPGKLTTYSTAGALHQLFSTLVFFGLPGACFVLARRFAQWHQCGWAIYSLVSGLLFLIVFVPTSAGFAQAPGLVDYGGLFQRVTLTIGWLWTTLLAVHMWQCVSQDQK